MQKKNRIIQNITEAIKEAFWSFSPERSFTESIMQYDFQINSLQKSLMQYSFPLVALWPLVCIFLILLWDPFYQNWSVHQLLGADSDLVMFLSSGQQNHMVYFFLAMFVFQWLFRIEFLLYGFIIYFVNRMDLHLHLALSGIMGICLSRICYQWWLGLKLEPHIKKIWNWGSSLQLISFLLVLSVSLYLLDFLQVQGMFSNVSNLQIGKVSRVHFLMISILFFYGLCQALLMLWGHFYVRLTPEPSEIRIKFSTAEWILRFKPSSRLQKLIEEQLKQHLENNEQYLNQLGELEIIQPRLSNSMMRQNILKEQNYLKEASYRLAKM